MVESGGVNARNKTLYLTPTDARQTFEDWIDEGN